MSDAPARSSVEFDPNAEHSLVESRGRLRDRLRGRDRLTSIGMALAFVTTATGMAVFIPSQRSPSVATFVVLIAGLLMIFARERRGRLDNARELSNALELSNAYRGTALMLGDVIESDDSYTGSHSREVVGLVLAVADELGLDARERRLAEFTALLHDVGKIAIPNEIINKPGPLTYEERALIQTHTIEGQRALEKVGGVLGEVGRIVRGCHERFDGGGYPDGLRGEEISLVARIVCCCDAFSAMTTDRPYRPARPADKALAELNRCAGTQFDPAVVQALAATLAKSNFALLDLASSPSPWASDPGLLSIATS